MIFEEENFICISEAAKLLGVHKNTLYHWVKEDWKNKNNNKENISAKFLCPPYFRIGTRYKFKREDIKMYMKNLMKS